MSHNRDQNSVVETNGIEDVESNVLLEVLLDLLKQYDEDQVEEGQDIHQS
ncbi:uncharacterized protein EV154DRAFT_566386 [Mucor mucedo]|nr:uncharacterized protein EV154DRAFT_566386 [Mucor mucedo]KAI7888507.1 hypothetical protein EV154DRAFT_566386 [Mucor mucedo]